MRPTPDTDSLPVTIIPAPTRRGTALQQVLEEVLASVACGPTVSLGWTKRALAAATHGALESVQTIEAKGQQALVETEDFREGARAFRERRAPEFRGY